MYIVLVALAEGIVKHCQSFEMFMMMCILILITRIIRHLVCGQLCEGHYQAFKPLQSVNRESD